MSSIEPRSSCCLATVLVLSLLWSCTGLAACAGPYAELETYAGRDDNFFDEPLVVDALARLPLELRTHLRRNLSVAGSPQLEGCHLVLTGNAPHMGTEQDAMLDFDLATGTILAVIHDNVRIDVYLIAAAASDASPPTWSSLPQGMQAWIVKADMGFAEQTPTDLVMPASVRFHALTQAPSAELAPATLRVEPIEHPTPAQFAAIRAVAGGDPGNCVQDCFDVSAADLDDDGLADLIVRYGSGTGFCGSAGCAAFIVMATPEGYASTAIGLPYHSEIAVLASKHQGMHDLQFDRFSPIWHWNGDGYAMDAAASAEPVLPGWENRWAGNRSIATVSVVRSVISALSVFCDGERPVLAALTKLPLAAESVTLTFVFRGWLVNTALVAGNREGTLWLAALSRSDLPQWFAHRGTTTTTAELARLSTQAYLRTTGSQEGEISLQDSTATTQAALAGCYRY